MSAQVNGQTPGPRFYFRVDEMIEYTQRPRSHPETGDWLPPRSERSNRILPNQNIPPGTAYFFDGHRTQQRLVSLPRHLQNYPYSTYSMYCGVGASLWIVPYDATVSQVYNGRDDGIERRRREQSTDVLADWRELRFRSARNNPQRVSHATFDGDRNVLRWWRPSQEWVTQIIPAPYRPEMRSESRRGDAPQGGLTGDLALLIGLLALSIPLSDQPGNRLHLLMYWLPRCVQSTFYCVAIQYGLLGNIARQIRRGVLVKVWADIPALQAASDPQRRQEWEQMSQRIIQAMRAFENGANGPLFR